MLDIIVVIAMAFVGMLVASIIDKYQYRQEEVIGNVYKFCSEYHTNVSTSKHVLSVFLSKTDSEIKHCIEQLMISQCSVRLCANDCNMLREFIAGINCVNSVDLLAHLDRYNYLLSNRYNELHDKNSKMRSISKKVGFLLGAVVGMLFI